MRRRSFLTGVVSCAASATALRFASGQPLADRQIRLIVPFPAGGPTDIVARPLALFLGNALKANIVVDNRGGAGGSLGADVVAKAAPDGSTLLMGTVGTHAINASLYKKLPYDPVRDFTPISLVAAAPVAVVVHPSIAAKSLADLVALAKASPGKLTYGSAGNGTPGHLTAEMFKATAGINIQHVPYRGSAPAVNDLVGGQINIMFDPLQSVLTHVKGGNLRALAVSSVARSPVLPDVPTIAESGYKDFESTAWWGLFAPAHLPADLTAQLAAETGKIVRGATFREKLEPLGVVPTALSGAEFSAFQGREIVKWGKAVHDSGASID
jgi:tripartite-type tricarboxylate transporter receptor subunit TctC